MLKKILPVVAVLLLLASSAVMIVSAPAGATPYTGPEPTPTNLTLYLHNTSTPVYVGSTPTNYITNTINDTNKTWLSTGAVDVGLHYVSISFYIYPQLQGQLSINGTPVLGIYMNKSASASTGGSVSYSLYSISTGGKPTLLGSAGSASLGLVAAGSLPNYIEIPYGSRINQTLPAGYTVEVNITVSGTSSGYYGLWWGNVKDVWYYSALNLPASTYLNVENISLYNSAGKVVSVLSPDAANKTITIVANITDPLGVYDFVNWSVNIAISNKTAVIQSGKMKPAGKTVFFGYNLSYSFTFNYTGYAAGEYTVTVNATDNTYHNLVDQNTGNNYYGRNAYGYGFFFIGTPPIYVTLSIRDSMNNTLVNATVRIYAGLTYMLTAKTNSSGIAGVYLSGNATYGAEIFWEGVNVSFKTFTVSQANHTFVFIVNVFYPVFHVLDHGEIPVSNAFVYIVHPNGTHYPMLVTDGSGNVYLNQVPIGMYNLTIIWHDSVVYEGTLQVSKNGDLNITVAIYYQIFEVYEPGMVPINLADLLVVNSTSGVILAFNITNINGETTVRIPAGIFLVKVFWKTSIIATVTLPLPNVNPYNITGTLYRDTFTAVDSNGMPVSNVDLAFYQNNSYITTLVTSANGTVSYLFPAGSYSITAIYDGIPVGYSNITVTGNSNYLLKLKIYYAMFTAVDSRNIPVSNAIISIFRSGNLLDTLVTSGNGTATARVPVGTYTVETRYDGIAVGNATENVSSNENITLSLAIYYLTLTAYRNDGTVLSNVFVEIYYGTTLFEALTATNGTAVFRLPAGKYRIVALYFGTYGFTAESQTVSQVLFFNSSRTMSLTFSSINMPFTSTVEFLMILAIAVLLAVMVVLFFVGVIYSDKIRRKGKAADAPAGKETESANETPAENKTSR